MRVDASATVYIWRAMQHDFEQHLRTRSCEINAFFLIGWGKYFKNTNEIFRRPRITKYFKNKNEIFRRPRTTKKTKPWLDSNNEPNEFAMRSLLPFCCEFDALQKNPELFEKLFPKLFVWLAEKDLKTTTRSFSAKEQQKTKKKPYPYNGATNKHKSQFLFCLFQPFFFAKKKKKKKKKKQTNKQTLQ